MANKRDYYQVLGIDKSAGTDEIKKAYRELVKKYHPDVNKAPDAETKFKEVQEAYEILSDQEKRSAYDQFGHAAFENGGAGFNAGGFQNVDLGDIFASFFGGGGRRQAARGPQRGSDVRMGIDITFMEAVEGITKKINVKQEENCIYCHGSGAESPKDISTCSRCKGSGVIHTQARSIFGIVNQEAVCPDCRGQGQEIKKKCSYCRGRGYESVSKEIELKIAAGIDSGQMLRLVGKGERGEKGGEHGDLYVEVHVAPHQFFKRDGADIHLEVPLSFIDASLGCKIDVPGLQGDITVSIAEGTQPDAVLRLKGKGIKRINSSSYGDQYLHIKLATPTNLGKAEKDLLEQLRQQQAIAKKENIFDKFKKKFKK